MSVIFEKAQRLRSDIIKHFYYKTTLSLADLSSLTQKSLPVVRTVVSNLVSEGYILEKGLAPSTGGRRPSIYVLNPKQQKYLVAVAMEQLTTRLTIYNLSRKTMIPVQYLDLELSKSTEDVEILIKFIRKSIDKSKLNRSDILGIGIGMPGFVNPEQGINSSYLPVKEGTSLQDYLRKNLRLPVMIENDSSLIALAELNFGKARELSDVMVVNIGSGTGLGIIINGSLYRGSRGYAGEFSHVPLSDTNNLCSCGKRGCLEVDTSLKVMARKAEKAIEEGAESSMSQLFKDKSTSQIDHFLEAVVAQDPLAISILSHAAFQLGKGLSTLIHILNPECIVLSGRGAKAGKMLLPSIQQAINEFCIPRISDSTSIELSTLSYEAELLAAGSLVIENSLFETNNISQQ
ncbi:ROK family protein [Pedobacter sp. Leaf176]|uniref:ROK family protein n=1 Tax=Pedobacter sp. Leaf176 TaxID=1736286 RepID=UPI0007016C2A|nr:ROK family protein [Pedobacter sp. Leaf176]KQR66844.1 ROK family transcriptional regulator [Pedobacter sp. Leaf176]